MHPAAVEPDADSVARTRKMMLLSVWVAAAAAVGASVAIAVRSGQADEIEAGGESEESLAVRLARENDAYTRETIRACFVDAIDAARAIQNAGEGAAFVTDSMRGAFLRATEELFTLERTYGRERMVQEIGPSYTIAVRKLQAMLQ
jgi:hypothetical protein